MSTGYQIGESFVGEGVNAAHINVVHGARSGPAGTAWATALATPSAGHEPFVVVLKPSLPVKPLTLFVSKAVPRQRRPRAADLGPGAGRRGRRGGRRGGRRIDRSGRSRRERADRGGLGEPGRRRRRHRLPQQPRRDARRPAQRRDRTRTRRVLPPGTDIQPVLHAPPAEAVQRARAHDTPSLAAPTTTTTDSRQSASSASAAWDRDDAQPAAGGLSARRQRRPSRLRGRSYGGGAVWADSPATGASSDLVITMLPTPRIVTDVVSGPTGCSPGCPTAAPGSTCRRRSRGGRRCPRATTAPRPARARRAGQWHVGRRGAGMLQIFVGGDVPIRPSSAGVRDDGRPGGSCTSVVTVPATQ